MWPNPAVARAFHSSSMAAILEPCHRVRIGALLILTSFGEVFSAGSQQQPRVVKASRHSSQFADLLSSFSERSRSSECWFSWSSRCDLEVRWELLGLASNCTNSLIE